MAPLRWLFDRARAIFRRGKTEARAVALRDAVAARAEASVSDLAGQLSRGDITLGTWTTEMSTRVRAANVAQFLIGVGGKDGLTPALRDGLAQDVSEQLTHLRGFARDIAAGGLTADDIAARTALYFDSSIGAYERGRGLSRGHTLPAYPPAHPRCRCSWEYDENDGEEIATWRTAADERVCPICTGLASQYDRLALGTEATTA